MNTFQDYYVLLEADGFLEENENIFILMKCF